MASLPTPEEGDIPVATPAFRLSAELFWPRVWISIASAYASLWAFSGNSFGSLRFPYSGGRAGVGRGSDLQGGSTDQVWEQRLRALELGMRQLQTSMQTLVDGVPLSGELPSGPSTAAHDRGWSGTNSGWSAGLARAPPRRDSRESACQDVADGIRRARQARGASQGGRETEQRSSRQSEDEGVPAGGDGAALAPGDQVSRAAGRSSRSRQAAIDQGNWLLASEFSMQPSPPFSAFQRPRGLDPLETRQTKILDPRWISVFMARLKERDAFHTARRNLTAPGAAAPSGATVTPEAPAGGSGDPPRKPPRKPGKGGTKGDLRRLLAAFVAQGSVGCC
eukprot:s250_g27.t2